MRVTVVARHPEVLSSGHHAALVHPLVVRIRQVRRQGRRDRRGDPGLPAHLRVEARLGLPRLVEEAHHDDVAERTCGSGMRTCT